MESLTLTLTEHLTGLIALLRATIARRASHRVPLHVTTPVFWNRRARILRLFQRLEQR